MPPSLPLNQPNLCATLAKTNWSHSTAGTVAGCFVLLLTLMDLVMFLTNTTSDQAECSTSERSRWRIMMLLP